MGYFEFPDGLRIICVPLNIPEKVHWQHLFENPNRQRLIVFILANTIQYPRTLKSKIYHSNKRGPPLFFHLDINPVLGRVLIHSVDKTHVLVEKGWLIWLLFLNILSFNFVPTPNKSLKLTRFTKSYVNHSAVFLNNRTSYTAFFSRCAMFKVATFLFCSCLPPMLVDLRNLHFFEHTCCSNVANSKVGMQTKRCEIVIHEYNKTNSLS